MNFGWLTLSRAPQGGGQVYQAAPASTSRSWLRRRCRSSRS